MNIKFSGVLVGMIALFTATSASASPRTDDGHYEWRSSIQAPGPRAPLAPLAASRRVWVNTAIATTDVDTGHRMMGAMSDTMACCAPHSS